MHDGDEMADRPGSPVFRAADALGAHGTLMFVGVGTSFTYRLTLAGPGGKSTFAALDSRSSSSPAVRQVIAAAAAPR